MFTAISNDDLYRLMDILTINDISAILAGENPNQVDIGLSDKFYLKVSDGDYDNKNSIFKNMLNILTRAVLSGELPANIAVLADGNKILCKEELNQDWLLTHEIDTSQTTITKNNLIVWLKSKGVYPSVFFPNGRKDDYMNPEHEAYSPELAICVRAWEIAQTADYPDRTVKQFMADWILANAKAFNLREEDGKELGQNKAKGLASVANWAKQGGNVKGNPLKKGEPTPLNGEPTPLNGEPTPLNQNHSTIPNELKINLPENPLNKDEDLPF